MANTFLTPNIIYSGENALSELHKQITNQDKIMIVTDDTMVKLGHVKKITDIIEECNATAVVFSKINSEPDDLMIKDGVTIYKENACNKFIAIGGGSPIDSMKAIAALINEDHDIAYFMGKTIDKVLPQMIAIPTTAGTGSEATMFTIISDTKTQVKMLLKGECLIPNIAIIDPQFTLSVPASVTSHTGIDALCHAIEAYTSRKAQPLSDTFALSAIRRIINNLPIVFKQPDDVEARKQMALAALEAGIAFNNSSVTIIHGMSRPIGALFHVAHGLSNAILMENCLQFALNGAYARFAEIARFCNISTNQNDQYASEEFMKYLHNFLQIFNLPIMSEIGIDRNEYEKMIDKMAKDAQASGSPGNTIKSVSIQDMKEIYLKTYH